MSLFGDIKKVLKGVMGNTSLEEATKSSPKENGCYKIFYKNKLKYTGSAEVGIRKKLKNLYEGKITNNEVALKIYENRKDITVSWVVFKTKQECIESSEINFNRYKAEWNLEEIKSKNINNTGAKR